MPSAAHRPSNSTPGQLPSQAFHGPPLARRRVKGGPFVGKADSERVGLREQDEVAFLDGADPDFDTESEAESDAVEQCTRLKDVKERANQKHSLGDGETVPEPALSFSAFRERLDALCTELFATKDVGQCLEQIERLDCWAYSDEIIVAFAKRSLDRDEACQELVSTLVSQARGTGLVSRQQAVRGFEKLVVSWEDLAIDVPAAPTAIVRFLERAVAAAVVDDWVLDRVPEGLLHPAAAAETAPFGPWQSRLAKLKDFKAKLAACIKAFFISESVDEVDSTMLELGSPHLHHELVQRALLAAAEQKDREQSLVAERLLPELYGERVLARDVQLGVSRALAALAELAVDAKHAPSALAGMLTQLTINGCLAPSFVAAARRLRMGGSYGLQVLTQVQRSTPELSRRWWGSAGVARIRDETIACVNEYMTSREVAEAARIVRELSFNPREAADFVRRLGQAGLEAQAEAGVAVALLRALVVDEELASAQVASGLRALHARLDDLVLDCPSAREGFQQLVDEAKRQQCVDIAFVPADRSAADGE